MSSYSLDPSLGGTLINVETTVVDEQAVIDIGTVDAGKIITVRMTTWTDGWLRAGMQDADGAWVRSNGGNNLGLSTSAPAGDAWVIPVTGDYKIIIEGYESFGTATIIVYGPGDDQHVYITPGVGGADVDATIGMPGERCIVTFNASPGADITVKQNTATWTDRTDWEFDDPLGDKIAAYGILTNDEQTLGEWTLESDGVYTFTIAPNIPAGTTGSGTFHFGGTGFYIELRPDPIASGEEFGTPGIMPETINLAGRGIGSAESFGRPDLIYDQFLAADGIASAERFGRPYVSFPQHLFVLAGIPSRAAVGRPRVSRDGQTLRPGGIPGGLEFGAIVVGSYPVQFVRPHAIDTDEDFGEPTLGLPGTIAAIIPAAIGPSEQFGDAVIFVRAVGIPPRNYLIDRVSGEIYPWPVNHATEDSIKSLGRRLTRSGITASGKLLTSRKFFLVKHPTHPGPVRLMLHGTFLDREPPTQYQTFVRFFRESDNRTFEFIDASGDAYHVALTNFDARRGLSPAFTDGNYFSYDLELEIIDVQAGALGGYTS